MKKFTHIEAFHQVARAVAKVNGDPQIPDRHKVWGPVLFRGTVKIHGTNAGVALTSDAIVPQSRSRELALGDDNLGWAQFVSGEDQKQAIREIEAVIRKEQGINPEDKLTLFGEWCGPGIQKGCGIHQVPQKMWVLFAVVLGDGDDARYLNAIPEIGDKYAAASIYSILDGGPKWELTVDFNDRASLEAAAERATELTAEVERQCPWAARFGAEGIGEGIVWTPMGDHWGDTRLFFKTKGILHKQASPREGKTQIRVDPSMRASAQEFVDSMLDEDRLQQGVDFLREQGMALEPRSIGEFLKWISQDVQREGASDLEVSGLEWKVVSKAVSNTARNWFLKLLHEL